MLNRITIIWNTIRYMTFRQWKYRLYYIARNKLIKRRPKICDNIKQPLLLPLFYEPYIKHKADLKIADGICNNEFLTVSGIVKTFDEDVDWNLQDETYRLVCFRLNSFGWLIHLSDAFKETGEQKYIDKGFEFISDWNKKNLDRISGDKWNAYVIAERIVNWICFCSQYCKDKEIEEYAAFIYSQAYELKCSIEYQLGANHLLSEAKALIYAGAFLQDEDFYNIGKSILFSEANEQFLNDGGHYERSVSYHVESLQQYFESYAILKSCKDPDIDKIVNLMIKPYKYLNGMISVNGNIPLFNDSAYDYPFYDATDFLTTASLVYFNFPTNGNCGRYYERWKWLGKGDVIIDWENNRCLYETTGYIHYRFEESKKEYSFFMDVADCGPDYNLGHAHADALSVLLYSKEKEILVDSGVFTYKSGNERNLCRSTRAHNTVEIDDTSSAQIWSAFRVAKRGHTKIHEFTSDNKLYVKASHDGYIKCLKKPVEHFREVNIRNGEINITDTLKGKTNQKAILRFILGPKCDVVQVDEYQCVIDNELTICTENPVRLVPCNVASFFGEVEDSTCIEMDFDNKDIIKTIIKLNKKENNYG